MKIDYKHLIRMQIDLTSQSICSYISQKPDFISLLQMRVDFKIECKQPEIPQASAPN